jgi:hypothetical protein
MFIDFYDYLYQILSWCKLNCLEFNKKHNLHEYIPKKMLSKEDLLDEWVDYGFGENEVIH